MPADRDIVLNVGMNVKDVEATSKNLRDEIEQIFRNVDPNKVDTKMQGLLSTMNKLHSASSTVHAKMKQLESVTVPTVEYQAYEKELDKLNAKMQALEARQEKFKELGGKTDSTQFKSMQYDAAVLEQKINDIVFNMQVLESFGQHETLGINTEEYAKLAQRLNEINNQGVTTIGRFEAIGSSVTQTSSYVNSASNHMQTFGNIVSKVGNIVATAMSHLASTISKVASNLTKLPINIAVTAFKKLASAVKTVLAHLTKLASSGITNGIKRLSNVMGGLNKNTEKSNVAFKRGLNTFIKYAFGVRSVYFLVRKLRTALIEGFGDLAKVSEPFNEAVSNMRTALRLLRNSFAAAFSPIIEVVSPILTKFITQMAEAVNKIGQMLAALTGQKTYMRAIAVYQDYAESLDKSSKSADKASKSTKKLKDESEKLKKTLAGFDDVEILKGPDDNGDDDSGLDLSDLEDSMEELEEPQWEEVAIGERFKNLSDLLKRAWEKADFTEVGTILGEKLKAALENIPWDGIKEVLRKIGKSIATFLNGFLEVPGLFTEIGKTIAQGINSAFEFVEAFVSNFHWKSLGKAIKDLIFGVLDTIDWKLIYKTVGEFAKGIGTTINEVLTDSKLWKSIFASAQKLIGAILKGINTFLKTVKWSDIGKAIGDGLNGAIERLDDLQVGATIARIINSLFSLAGSLINRLNWKELGTQIKKQILQLLKGIDWGLIYSTLKGFIEGIGEVINEVFGDIIPRITTALNAVKWSDIGKVISNGLNTAIANINKLKIGEAISSIINSFFSLTSSLINGLRWNELGTQLKTLILEFLNGIQWQDIYSTVKGFANGIGTAIQHGLNDPEVLTQLFTAVAKLIGLIPDAINSFISSISWGDFGTNIGTALNNAIETFPWDSIAQTLITLINGAFDLWFEFVTTFDFAKFGDKIGTKLAEVINGIDWEKGATAVAETMNGLLDALNAFMEKTPFKSIGFHIAEMIATFLNDVDWKGFGTFLSNCLKALLDVMIGFVTDEEGNDTFGFDKLGDEICQHIGEALIGFDWSGVAHRLLELLATDIGNSIFEFFGISKMNPGRALAERLGSTTEEEWQAGVDSLAKDGVLDTFAKAVKNEVKKNADLEESGMSVSEGLKAGISGDWLRIATWVASNIVNPFIDSTNEGFDSHSPSKKMLPVGENVAQGLKKGITDDLQNINSWTNTNVFDPTNSAFLQAFGISNGVADTIIIVGNSIVNGIRDGIDSHWPSILNWISGSAIELQNIFHNQDWSSIGNNICSGIYEGLNSGWDWLTTSAWNLATSIYNTACNALDIGSPSKLFRNEVGKMIPAGMALGILDNEGLVENAMGTLTETVANTGQQALKIPAVVKGSVIPYQATISSQTENALAEVVGALESNYSEQLTRDDLQDILVNVLSTYLNISFYMGDEQIARHANAGNAKLSRRFNKLDFGGA